MIKKQLSLLLLVVTLTWLNNPIAWSQISETASSIKTEPKTTYQRSELSEKERVDLQAEFNRLAGELRQLSQQFGGGISLPNINLFDTEKNTEQSTTETVNRVQSIQKRMREIQQNFPNQTRRQPPPSKEQIEARIQTLQAEIQGASQGIEELVKSNPNSDEVRILQRKLRHKKRTLAWLLGQQQRLELVSSQTETKPDRLSDEDNHSDTSNRPTESEMIADSSRQPIVEMFDLRELEFFKIHHISATSVIPIVMPFLSTNDTPIVVDINTNSIIVKDLPHVLLDLDRILTYVDQPVSGQSFSKVESDQVSTVVETAESAP